jgi:hypothetical protein
VCRYIQQTGEVGYLPDADNISMTRRAVAVQCDPRQPLLSPVVPSIMLATIDDKYWGTICLPDNIHVSLCKEVRCEYRINTSGYVAQPLHLARTCGVDEAQPLLLSVCNTQILGLSGHTRRVLYIRGSK